MDQFSSYFPSDNFVSGTDTPSGQLQPWRQPDADFTPQIQSPMVRISGLMYDTTWGTPIPLQTTAPSISPPHLVHEQSMGTLGLLQTHFPAAYYHLASSTPPSTSPPHFESVWDPTDHTTTEQMMSQVRARPFRSVGSSKTYLAGDLFLHASESDFFSAMSSISSKIHVTLCHDAHSRSSSRIPIQLPGSSMYQQGH